MMRRKLLHGMKEVRGATSFMMKDELIVVEHQVDGTRLLIYIYTYLYIDVWLLFLPYLHHSTMITSIQFFLLHPEPS